MTDALIKANRITLLWLGEGRVGSDSSGLLLNGTLLTQDGFEPRSKLDPVL